MRSEQWRRAKDVFTSAVELPARERELFIRRACEDDVALRRDVEALLKAHESSDSFIERPAAQRAGLASAPIDWIGRRFGPYRIVGEVERGGMSEVYRAVRDDNQYQKDVAIKFLRHGFDSESLLRRFRAERQILAQLNHPHIAHLVDGGTTENGMPYLVMEYIQGQPIDVYCEQRKLGIRERVDLVRTLCGAVHYVHQHLMVHGDLKCNNVLVTERGVLKLLDFGIAKLLNPPPALGGVGGLGGDRFTSGYIALTPDYASPEQLLGEPITTASDVYSLGVLLYRLLAGRLPFHMRSALMPEEIKELCEVVPERPSVTARRAGESYRQFARHLEGDLDSIILKAIAKSPEDRYGSVEQLSEDLLSYLRGFPVRAHSDGAAYRAKKFVLRNRLATAAIALFVLAMTGGIATTLWLAHLADVERWRAARHFEIVRKFAHSYMTEVHGAIENLPGSITARKLLIDTSLKHLSELAKEETSDNPMVRHDLASAYEKIGDIQGRLGGANMGDTDGAIANYRIAIRTRESLLAAEGNNVELQRDLLRAHGKLAELLMVGNEPAAATEHFREITQIASTLANAPDATVDDRRGLGNAYLSYGWHCVSLGHLENGLELMLEAAAHYRALLAAEPNDIRARRNLALSHHRMGYTLIERTERYEEGARYLTDGLAMWREMSDADPNNGDLSRAQAYTAMALASARLKLDQPREALPLFEEAYRRFDAFRAADPGDFEAPIAAAHALGQVSAALLAIDEPREALSRLAVAETLLRNQNPSADRELPETQYYEGLVYLQLGKTHSRLATVGGPLPKAEHRRLARSWLGKTIESMKRASVDTAHGGRAKERLREAELQLEELRNPAVI
ncbi:protein kinase [Steroidobacter flavus]|uniref:Protein kinase n=1 Tax=Steroidobacter flavus TaxID=1842136 RepID=A0ABV8SXG3_9GAMM